MILDAQLEFSSEQALTVTAASTNIVDLGADRNIGIGKEMAVLLVLDVASDNTTEDETYSVAVQADDNASFSSAGTVTTFTIAAGAAAGTKYAAILPKDTLTERYIRLNYTLGGTTPSVTVSAYLVPSDNIDAADVYYASGFTVS